MGDIPALILGVALGAICSWAITWWYYRRGKADQADAAMSQRLDTCTEGDKTFLVALLQHGAPLPRYATINLEFEAANGRKGTWGSNTTTMVRSVNFRVPMSLLVHSDGQTDEDVQTVTLTERGRKNAEYVQRTEYPKARFVEILDGDEQRARISRYEHNRDPRRAAGRGPSVVVSTGN